MQTHNVILIILHQVLVILSNASLRYRLSHSLLWLTVRNSDICSITLLLHLWCHFLGFFVTFLVVPAFCKSTRFHIHCWAAGESNYSQIRLLLVEHSVSLISFCQQTWEVPSPQKKRSCHYYLCTTFLIKCLLGEGLMPDLCFSFQSPDAFCLPQLSYSPDSTHTPANKPACISQLLQLCHCFHSSSFSHASLSELFLTIAFQSLPKPVPGCHLELYLSVIKTTQLLLPAWTLSAFASPSCALSTLDVTHTSDWKW